MKSQDDDQKFVDKKYKWYLFDVGLIIKERAREAVEERKKFDKGSSEYDYNAGRIMGFNEVISILQQGARGFNIPLEEIRIEDIDPDHELV